VLWGGLHGAALVIEHSIADWRRRLGSASPFSPRLGHLLGVIASFHFVCLTWIFFRASDLPHALAFLQGFARIDVLPHQITPLTLLLLAGTMAAQFLPEDRLARLEAVIGRVPLTVQGLAVGLAIITIDACGPPGVAPFIYFQF